MSRSLARGVSQKISYDSLAHLQDDERQPQGEQLNPDIDGESSDRVKGGEDDEVSPEVSLEHFYPEVGSFQQSNAHTPPAAADEGVEMVKLNTESEGATNDHSDPHHEAEAEADEEFFKVLTLRR